MIRKMRRLTDPEEELARRNANHWRSKRVRRMRNEMKKGSRSYAFHAWYFNEKIGQLHSGNAA